MAGNLRPPRPRLGRLRETLRRSPVLAAYLCLLTLFYGSDGQLLAANYSAGLRHVSGESSPSADAGRRDLRDRLSGWLDSAVDFRESLRTTSRRWSGFGRPEVEPRRRSNRPGRLAIATTDSGVQASREAGSVNAPEKPTATGGLRARGADSFRLRMVPPRTVSRSSASATSGATSGPIDLPLRTVTRSAARREVGSLTSRASTAPSRDSAAAGVVAQPAPSIASLPSESIALELQALAASLGNSPGALFAHVHDQVQYEPHWGASSTPLGVLQSGVGSSWEQAWLLQELLIAAGVDARLEWGKIRISPEQLRNLTGVDDLFRAGDLLTTAGAKVILLINNGVIVGAELPHVWVKAFLDYSPHRGAYPGPGDTWVRLDPSLPRYAESYGERQDAEVLFDLGSYLASGAEASPRETHELAMLAYAADQGLPAGSVAELQALRSQIVEDFPYVPGTLRGEILEIAGESTTLPPAMQVQLDLEIREVGGGVLATYSTGLAEVWGQRFTIDWPGATAADASTLELYGDVFATPPYEVELRPSIRLGGIEVATGSGVGSAEDVEVLATITPPDGVATFAFWELFAGEPSVLTVDFSPLPPTLLDTYAQAQADATSSSESTSWGLARAAGEYLAALNDDLRSLGALRWYRAINLGAATLAIQRGAVSVASDGAPVTFSRGPLALDVGAMPLGLFPVVGQEAADSRLSTLELLGSQASVREPEALTTAFGSDHVGAVTFLTRAVREGQILTRVDSANLEEALAAAELSDEAEAHVRFGVGEGLIAWIPEGQLSVAGWDTTGYVLEDPTTGAALYPVTFERLVPYGVDRITFHAPQDLEVITQPTEVIASVDAEEVLSWSLATQPTEGGASRLIGSGTGPVDQLTLGVFDPTLLLNGQHDLVLTAETGLGEILTERITVSVEGGMKIGHFSLSFVDLELPLAGIPIQIVRTYDSREQRSLDFGYGWSLGIRQGSYVNNRRPGVGWQILEGFLPCQQVAETKSHLTTIRLSDREVYRFRASLTSPAVVAGACYATAAFTFVDGPVPGARLEIVGNREVIYQNGTNLVVDSQTFEPFEPRDVRLTTRDGRVFDLDLEAGIERVADSNGNTLTITDYGITHSAGETVTFTRDTEGRITEIVDPAGEVLHYTYDGAGDLVGFEDREGATSSCTYTAGHYLEEITDPRGITPIRNEYDAEGRLTRHIDAYGNEIVYDHQLAANREIVTDRLGHSRLLEYDARGNVVREVDALGQEMRRSFDGDDNLLSETDALNQTTTYTYSGANDLLSVTDPLGNSSTYTYDSAGRVLTVTDPRGQVTSSTYDAAGNLLTAVDPLGNTSTFTYDSRGNLLSEVDADGNGTTFAYDGRGNLTRQTDALGAVSTYAYDANGNRTSQTMTRTRPDGSTETLTSTFVYDGQGRLSSATQPDGSSTTTTYDALGQVIASSDALGRTTSFVYDQLGRQTETTYPDTTTDSRTYDAEGRLLTATDRAGRTTTYAYDALGRMTSTTFVDGASTSSIYDAAGRLVTSTDARGNATNYQYDAAGRRTRVIDALGGQTDFVYDAAGNQTSVTDPNRDTTSFVYDDAGRLLTTTFPDGTTRSTAYDGLGRRVSETDQAGLTTTFGYDALGRLVSVTDALDQVTSYTYDELGNRLTQTDANGHTTSFEYDSLGRQVAREMPDGARETMAYDVVGNMTSMTDFMGRTTSFAYDVSNRRTAKVLPGGATIGYGYTSTGRRASVVDARGTTSYTYDTRDRLSEMTYPDGRRLTYGWDDIGNRTSLTAHLAGQTLVTTYSYDALNRLDTVTDADGRLYDHGYDANGNRASLTHPNGVTTNYQYDDLNRLVDLTSVHTATTTTVQSYAYTLGPAGNRTRIDEHDGTSRNYGYDALYRLTTETIADAGGQIYQKTFGYDPVGNRLSQVTTGAGADSVAYTYDDRDRITTEAGQSYSWDTNGNLAAKAGEATYGWDPEDRLESVTLADGTVIQHTYDADGVRVRTATTDGVSGETTTVDYLVDTSGPLSHVVAETDADLGVLTAHYVRGDDLLAVIRPVTGVRFYHADGLGSVRALTDEAGSVTDRWSFTAFGELLEHVGGDPNAYLFAGEPLDPNSGFYYNRARWMDPGVGRFVSVDPFGGTAESPVTLHSYLYSAADPVSLLDPTGLFTTVVGAVVTMAFSAQLMSRRLIKVTQHHKPIVVNLRPIVARFSGWEVGEVEQRLRLAQIIFSDQTDIILQWSSIEMDSTLVPATVERTDVLARLRGLHSWRVPIAFVEMLDSLDLGGIAILHPSDLARGAAVAREVYDATGGLVPTYPRVLAHELGHTIGALKHRKTYGNLMSYEPDAVNLDDDQIEAANRFARSRF